MKMHIGKDNFEAEVRRIGWSLGQDYNYVNAHTKVSVFCSIGHSISVAPKNTINGIRCPICSGKSRAHARINFERLVMERGYLLACEYSDVNVETKVGLVLPDRYVNAVTMVGLVCPEGHSLVITPSAFKAGRGCAYCLGKSGVGARVSFERLVEERGYALPRDYNYVNSTVKVCLVCSHGHAFEITPSSFKQGRGCVHCQQYKF